MRKVIAGPMLQLPAGGNCQWGERVVGVASNMGERLHKAMFVVRDQINTSSSLHTASELSDWLKSFKSSRRRSLLTSATEKKSLIIFYTQKPILQYLF